MSLSSVLRSKAQPEPVTQSISATESQSESQIKWVRDYLLHLLHDGALPRLSRTCREKATISYTHKWPVIQTQAAFSSSHTWDQFTTWPQIYWNPLPHSQAPMIGPCRCDWQDSESTASLFSLTPGHLWHHQDSNSWFSEDGGGNAFQWAMNKSCSCVREIVFFPPTIHGPSKSPPFQ